MAQNESKKRKQQKRQAIVRLLMLAAILVFVNMIAARFHKGLDLTKEKKFTLSNATKTELGSMKDVAVVTVYLEGDLSAGYQRLKEATREKLQSFKDYAGANLVFKFEDPFEGKTEDEKAKVYNNLAEKGIFAKSVRTRDNQSFAEQYVFPWALVQYQGKEAPVSLLEFKMGQDETESLNYSESQLEYKLIYAIHFLSQPKKTEVAYIMGHGESIDVSNYDLLTSLGGQYELDTLDLPNSLFIPPYYKAIVINKPTEQIDEKDKFKIDQYIMSGGHVLWVIDQLYTPNDSLMTNQQFIALDYGLNLDDQLFQYGVRINTDLIEDGNCAMMPVLINQPGNDQPQRQLKPWMYYPVFMPESNHSIVKNLDGIKAHYASTIDTIKTPGVKKTVLLASSKYSRKAAAPARVSLSMLRYPIQNLFKEPKKQLTTAVLLEGKFKSVFKNRLAPKFLVTLRDSLKRPFVEASDSSVKMIVISDGDIFKNDFAREVGPLEMGFEKETRTFFSNKTFFLNCMEYLTDESGILEARTKDSKLRLLDRNRIVKEEKMWQFVNIGIPILVVLIFASAYMFFRKRKYEQPLKK